MPSTRPDPRRWKALALLCAPVTAQDDKSGVEQRLDELDQAMAAAEEARAALGAEAATLARELDRLRAAVLTAEEAMRGHERALDEITAVLTSLNDELDERRGQKPRRPLDERKARLAQLLEGVGAPLGFSDHMNGSGDEVFAHACKIKLEGIISKRRDAAYVSGRSQAWLKTKCGMEQELVIIGWRPSDKAGRPFRVTVDPGGPHERVLPGLVDDEPIPAGTLLQCLAFRARDPFSVHCKPG